MKFIEIHFYCSLCFSGVPVLYTVFIVKGSIQNIIGKCKIQGGGALKIQMHYPLNYYKVHVHVLYNKHTISFSIYSNT